MKWIPWTGNENADYISRLTGFDDWQITQNLFSSSEELWGPHTVAFFTNYCPKKLQRFFSHFRNLGTSGTDFFPDLGFDNCLLVLPVFSCWSWCLLTVPTRRDSYSCCPSMAILLLHASSGSKYWSFIKGCFTLNGSQALTLARNLIIPWFSTSTGVVGKLTFEFL